jgi:hypothetical protein
VSAEHSLLLLSAYEDLFVACALHVVVADVNRIVADGTQPFGNDWRESVVDEEPHPAATSGSSRSRTASAA